MPFRPLAFALVLMGVLPLAPATAVEETSGPLYVIVPFGEPGDSDPVFKQATQQFGLMQITKEALADAADQFANRPAPR